MFKQQRAAVGYVPGQQLGLLEIKLKKSGYETHAGLRVERDGEVAAYRRCFHSATGYRQNHVQIVERGDVFAVYAHTEPHTQRLIAHAISAVADEASFAGGSKMLRNDLADAGFELMTYAVAKDAARKSERRRA